MAELEKPKRRLEPAARAVIAAWNNWIGDSDDSSDTFEALGEAINNLRDALKVERQSASERAIRSQIRRMTPEERTAYIARAQARIERMREVMGEPDDAG